MAAATGTFGLSLLLFLLVGRPRGAGGEDDNRGDGTGSSAWRRARRELFLAIGFVGPGVLLVLRVDIALGLGLGLRECGG